jgi:hypothetical protein
MFLRILTNIRLGLIALSAISAMTYRTFWSKKLVCLSFKTFVSTSNIGRVELRAYPEMEPKGGFTLVCCRHCLALLGGKSS